MFGDPVLGRGMSGGNLQSAESFLLNFPESEEIL